MYDILDSSDTLCGSAVQLQTYDVQRNYCTIAIVLVVVLFCSVLFSTEASNSTTIEKMAMKDFQLPRFPGEVAPTREATLALGEEEAAMIRDLHLLITEETKRVKKEVWAWLHIFSTRESLTRVI